MATSKKLLVLGLAIAAALGAGIWALALHSHQDVGALRVSGNIEAVEVNISFKIPGRVVTRLVDEGDRVTKDMVVAQLDRADLEADVAVRRAEVQVAESALAELKAGSRPDEIAAARAVVEKAQALLAELKAGNRPQEIAAAKADLDATKVEQDRLELEMKRADQLFRRQSIAEEQFDQALAAYRVAFQRHVQAQKRYDLSIEGPRKEQIDQAQAALAQLQAQYRLVQEGPRVEVIDQGRARVEQAKATLRLLETRLSYATVTSPVTGVVLSKNVEPGEYVAPGTPVVTVADIENIWLRAYVDERDVGQGLVQWGQEAEITTDAYPGKVYKGRISFISSQEEFTPKSVQTQKERVKLVYRIKIDVKNPDRELKPGMPADARIIGRD